jgi:hypothetical protein
MLLLASKNCREHGTSTIIHVNQCGHYNKFRVSSAPRCAQFTEHCATYVLVKEI